jgi:hypothetical protein
METLPVSQVLKKAADKAGFVRVRYEENKIPTIVSNVVPLLLFGDIRHSFTAASLLLKRFREENKGSKYFVLCSWPGQEALFPYVDEYWELNPAILSDVNHLRSIYNMADGFNNRHDVVLGCQRVLNTFFEDVLDGHVLETYWRNGLTLEFKERYQNIKRVLPSVPSSNLLGAEFNRRVSQQQGNKVFIYPTMYFQYWKHGKLTPGISSKEFWVALVERLLKEGYLPVIYHNYYTHDLSPNFLEKCLYLSNIDVSGVLAAMRATGCVLDVFSGISRLAIAARCPYLLLEERMVSNILKDYEIDDLCGGGIPKEYFYVFPAICEEINKPLWNQSLFDGIVVKLNSLMFDFNRDNWPSPLESYEIVPYDRVRRIKRKKFGTKFIKIPKY